MTAAPALADPPSHWPKRSWLADVEMSTVIVTTTYGESYKGLRRAVHDDCIILHEAFLLGEDQAGAVVVLNGDIVIPRDRVGVIQLVTP